MIEMTIAIGHESRSSTFFSPNRFQQQHHLNEIMHEASNDSSVVVMMINPGWHDKHCSSGKQWIVPKWRIGLLRRGGISACQAEKVLKTTVCCFSLQEEYLYEIKKVVTKSRGFVISKKKKKTRPAVNMSSMLLRRANLVIVIKIFNVRVSPKMKFTLTARFFFLKSIVRITKYYRLFWASPL